MVPPGGVIELPFEDRAFRVAEDVVRARLETFLTKAQLEYLLRLTTELVRAALHGQPPLLLRIVIAPDRSHAQVSVTDSSALEPGSETRPPDLPAAPGSVLVDLAARWGLEVPATGGHRWWVEIDAGS